MKVVVVGGGGHAKVVIATLEAAGHAVGAVYDDDPKKWGQRVLGVPIVGAISLLEGKKDIMGILAIGDNRRRESLARGLDLTWMSVVHPSAIIHASVRVGAGSVVFAGAVVQPDSVIGRHSIINTRATVDHDCQIADFCHLAPAVALAGGVSVEEGALIGIGARACPGASIGRWATVGAGAVVLKSVAPHTKAVGVPARVFQTIDELNRHKNSQERDQ